MYAKDIFPPPPPAWIAVLVFLTLFACSDVEELEPKAEIRQSAETSIHVRVPAFRFESAATVNSIDLYQFSDGVFIKKLSVDPTKDNTVEFARKPGSTIYALAGHSIEGSQKNNEHEFSTTTVPVPEGSYSAPIFFSSITRIPDEASSLDIELRRGVSRLDITNSDPELKIEKVSIQGAASCSHIFPTDGRTCDQAYTQYTRKFESGIDGTVERAFVLFETSSPIVVTISGRRNGKGVEITSQTTAIVRDRVYTVSVEAGGSGSSKERRFSDSGNDIAEDDGPTATIKIRDWEQGDLKDATIDFGESAIDIGKSFLPSGVRVISEENKVVVPAEGVTGMKLAFLTGSPLRLGSVVSDTEGVSIRPIEPEATGSGYISQFAVDVAKQPKGAAHSQTTVFFNGTSQFFINIYVDPSPYQIPTVHIGGHDWMCFNAVSQDPEEQIYLPKGTTVEKMYAERFVDCIGNFFQYGRPNPFSPWTAYDPNLYSGQKRNSPWTSTSMMPLPKGYHVASMDEWHDLLPHGVVIPSTYRTPTGDSIRATIVTLPGTIDGTASAAANAQQYLKRCVLFESVTTGAKLYLPMAGIKTNTSVEIPSHPNFRFDTKSGYWMKEDQQAIYLEYGRLSDGSEGIKFDHYRWHADGFVMVRGVRD